MRALVFENSLPRLAITTMLSKITPRAFTGPLAPIRLREIADPGLPRPDWVVIKTDLCGLCGSDYKQVFLNGTYDNPMTAMVSFPHVLGHEVVGRIARVGPAVKERRVGERVVLNPWLSWAGVRAHHDDGDRHARRGGLPARSCADGEIDKSKRGSIQPVGHSLRLSHEMKCASGTMRINANSVS